MKIVLAALLVLSLSIAGSYALKCYECLTESCVERQVQCFSYSKSCRKVNLNIGTRRYTVKGCALPGYNCKNTTYECQKIIQKSRVPVTGCEVFCCSGDFCNPSNKISPLKSLIVGFFLFFVSTVLF
mgnify:CR=1 FL=1